MNYHVLTQSEDGRRIQVVYHIPIPAGGTNQAGTSWRNVIVESAGGAAAINTVIPSVVGTQEETDMKAGALIEVSKSVKVVPSWTNAQKKTKIEETYTRLTTQVMAEKQVELAWFGFSADVI